jgi:hypothetical protein
LKTLKLYEIANEYREVLDRADDPEADLDSFIPALDGLELDLAAKAGHIACYIRELELEATAALEVVESAKKRAKRLEDRADWLRGYLLMQLQKTGITKVADPRVSIAIRKTPPAVFIPTVESVPADDRFWRVIPDSRSPDKGAIREALKQGLAVGDCELRTGERLEIK